ncbi:hypothetical protein [Pyxidicoccus trucidator]|uniref:hypothetical protein n=1 Tax=Pyxidicoccus trucidator TaxID=2709662 RepID=UPI0013DB6059|nr:hypothetical protein [Pyxidicoccus trucidator]
MSVITHPNFLTVVGIGLVVAVIMVTVRWKRWQRRIVAWQSFANQRGLEFSVTPGALKYAVGTLTMQGVYQGLPLLLFTEYRGHGEYRNIFTLLQLELGDALPPGLSLKPEQLGDLALKLIGYKDEEVGDAELDAALLLKNVTPRARALLVAPRVRGPLLKLGQAYLGFSLEDGFLRVERVGMPGTATELDAFMAPALLLARAVQATKEYTGARMG